MLLLVSELLWSLRRDGFAISTDQALQAVRAIQLVGFDEPTQLRSALAAVLVERQADRSVFNASFDRFFSLQSPHAADFWQRLRVRGFADAELSVVRDFLQAAANRTGSAGDGLMVQALAGSSSELWWLLTTSRMRSVRREMKGKNTAGYFTEKTMTALSARSAQAVFARLQALFADAFGEARSLELASALEQELAAMKRRVRATLEQELVKGAQAADAVGFGDTHEQRQRTQQAVRALAEKLEGQARVREKRSRRGRIELRGTLRAALRTGGVPMKLVRKRPRRDRAKAIVLCDLSDSVRTVSAFLLEFIAAAQQLLRRVRTFIFVSQVCEVTSLLRENGADQALSTIQSGTLISLSATSNYGRAFADLLRHVGETVDRRTTLVVLGDGRTNFAADGLTDLLELKRKARAVFWLCPEEPSQWGQADSRMNVYARHATVLLARSPSELEAAARTLVRASA
jgi:uncharacterized protein with von Willebrand factor type A (vWA) domain